MTDTTNVDWLNLNSQRAYPLSEQASGRDISGSITLPYSFIVGLSLSVRANPSLTPLGFFIYSVLIAPTGYTINIGYFDGLSQVVAATASIAKASHVENNSYILIGVGGFSDAIGSITVGNLDEVDQLPPGQYLFNRGGSQLDPDAIRPQIHSLSSLTLVNGSERSLPIYGDIELVAGTNVRLSVEVHGGNISIVTISAIAGEGLNQNCVCDGQSTAIPILTINGIPPGPDGDYKIAAENCVNIEPQTNGLLLTNSCASPCCGCKELDDLRVQLDLLSNNISTMENFQSRLSGEVAQMALVVLGSKIGDTSCGA